MMTPTCVQCDRGLLSSITRPAKSCAGPETKAHSRAMINIAVDATYLELLELLDGGFLRVVRRGKLVRPVGHGQQGVRVSIQEDELLPHHRVVLQDPSVSAGPTCNNSPL
ncbi:unnamed protein product [Nezara viridula]|uniref:Uncharacterized protein n=1 Tax=Nezara viridula TaxID=85310 RepID=A0A9P0HNB1_NEZVI|nr:unnamed protein product [Nezara viridula]